MGLCSHSCSLLTCITGWVFTGNFVLLFKKQNIITHLKAGVLRIEWKALSRASEALGECAASSQLSFPASFLTVPSPTLGSESLPFHSPKPSVLPLSCAEYLLILWVSAQMSPPPRSLFGPLNLGYILVPPPGSHSP